MFVCSECGASQPLEGRCPADGTPLSPIGEDLLLGTTIGAYRVARLLGVGGMGRVYKGVHPTIGSRVAIKVLSRECTDRRDLVERFFAEAKAVNLIRHESIVNILDLSTLPDGRPYIIMEYLDGAPLASVIEHAPRSPLPLGGLARLAVEVLDALSAAHAKGIVHRDLKPDNIFVTPSGRPKVLDFGIAKLSDLGTSATATGSLLGTPHYMSPEQAAGRPVDLRADIYAIGVILFEASTGHKPFLGESLFDLLRKHVEAPPPPPRSLRPDLPPELESVILTALAKPPDHRFASAHAMSMALQHATTHLAPDQWLPITPSGAHRGVPSGWQPTPPASWGGTSHHPAPPPTTMSASSGQVHRPPPPSRKGLWIGLGLLAAIGAVAIVAASVTSSGDDEGSPAVPLASPSDTDPKPASAVGAPDDPGEASDDQALEAALTDLGAIDPRTLPPEARKQLEDVKSLAKLPPHERLAKLKQLTKAMQGGGLAEAMDAIDAIPGSAGGASGGQAAPSSGSAGGASGGQAAPSSATPSSSPPSSPPGAWVVARDLAFAHFDPKRLDVSAFIRWAIAEAKKADPDAVLFRVDVNGVGPDGFANLELPSLASSHGSLDLRFFSPARAKPDPSLPIGVPDRGKTCEFRIEAEPSGVRIRPISGFDCKRNIAIPPPRCTAAALWKRALSAKAPQNAVASLGYRAWSGRFRWGFDIGFGADKAFSHVFEDDC